MMLSVMTPCAPGRFTRVQSMFERLSLNKERNPSIDFEFIMTDSSKNQEYQTIATEIVWPFPVKYISLPLQETAINASYPRNVGFRIAEGQVFTMIDVDHYVHEDFVVGALFHGNPNDCPGKYFLNQGYMIDTSKGAHWAGPQQFTEQSLINTARKSNFKEVMDFCGIDGPKPCNKVWLAAYPGDVFLQIGGNDECYTVGPYSSEDDSIFYRLARKLPIYNKGFEKFAGVHLWHPCPYRKDNSVNKAYYKREESMDIVRNKGYEWGKLVEHGFSIIDGIKLSFEEHEEYVKSLNRTEHYTSKPWKNYDEIRSVNEQRKS